MAAHRAPDSATGSVQADVGADHAQAVRAQEPQPVLAGLQPQLAFVARAGHPAFAEPGRYDHGCPDALAAAVPDDLRHGRRRREDHGEVGRLGQVEHAAVDRPAANLLVPQVDEVDRPGESAFDQVAAHDVAERSRGFAGPDEDDGRRLEEGGNALGGHDSTRAGRRFTRPC